MAWGATYGAWLGIAVPLIAGADDPAPFGIGLLAGTPAGFLAARAWAGAVRPTEGQTRAITFGGSWGTFQALGWAEALNLSSRTEVVFCAEDPSVPCYEYEEVNGKARVAAAVVGGLAGIATGAVLARKPIPAGTAAAVTSSALWGTWFGWSLSSIAGLDDDVLLGSTLVAGNAALAGSAALAPGWRMTESRMRLIDLGGLIGGLAGFGVMLIAQPDDEKVAIALPMLGSAAGLIAGVQLTRERAFDAGDGAGDRGGLGALISRDGGRWALALPDAGITVQRSGGAAGPAVYVPLLRARF
jgi:hypothetical protein